MYPVFSIIGISVYLMWRPGPRNVSIIQELPHAKVHSKPNVGHLFIAQRKPRGSVPNTGKTKWILWLPEPRKSQRSCLSGLVGHGPEKGGRSRLALRSVAANLVRRACSLGPAGIGSARSSRRQVQIGSWRFPGSHVLPASPPKKRGTAFKCYLVFLFLRRRCSPLCWLVSRNGRSGELLSKWVHGQFTHALMGICVLYVLWHYALGLLKRSTLSTDHLLTPNTRCSLVLGKDCGVLC